jgi:hypothetical protein
MNSPDTRRCARCGIEKPIDEFGFKQRERGIRQSWCKPCYAEYKRLWYLRNREEHLAHVKVMRERSSEENQRLMWQYLASHPCVDCGERDPVVLQFDHLRDKRTEISAMSQSGFVWETIPRRDRQMRSPLRQLPCCEDSQGARHLGTKTHDPARAIRF